LTDRKTDGESLTDFNFDIAEEPNCAFAIPGIAIGRTGFVNGPPAFGWGNCDSDPRLNSIHSKTQSQIYADLRESLAM
jgi:hypothetical protein